MDSDEHGWVPLPRFAPARRGLRCAPTALTDPSRGGKGSGRSSDARLSTVRSVSGLCIMSKYHAAPPAGEPSPAATYAPPPL